MTKFNADTEHCIANAIDCAQKNLGVKLSKVAVKFVVPYDLFYRCLHGRCPQLHRESELHHASDWRTYVTILYQDSITH